MAAAAYRRLAICGGNEAFATLFDNMLVCPCSRPSARQAHASCSVLHAHAVILMRCDFLRVLRTFLLSKTAGSSSIGTQWSKDPIESHPNFSSVSASMSWLLMSHVNVVMLTIFCYFVNAPRSCSALWRWRGRWRFCR